MSMRRRQFLQTAMAGTAGAWGLSRLASTARAETPASHDPLALVPLGRHLRVTRIGMGTGPRGWRQVSNLTKRGREHTLAVLRHAYDQGIRLFDMADLYGIHDHVAEAFRGKPREGYTLVSKIWFHPDGLVVEERPDADVVVRRFLKELRTDYLDLVQLHCMRTRTWPQEFRKQMDLLEQLKEQGLIRAHGVSCHSLDALEAAVEEPWVDVVHTRINPYGAKMDGPPETVTPILAKIHAAGKGIIGMKIIGEGEFAKEPEKREKSVDFALGLGTIDAMIVGFEQTAEIDEFVANVARGLRARV